MEANEIMPAGALIFTDARTFNSEPSMLEQLLEKLRAARLACTWKHAKWQVWGFLTMKLSALYSHVKSACMIPSKSIANVMTHSFRQWTVMSCFGDHTSVRQKPEQAKQMQSNRTFLLILLNWQSASMQPCMGWASHSSQGSESSESSVLLQLHEACGLLL